MIPDLLDNMDNSPLAKLPAELRLAIYKHVFNHQGHILMRDRTETYKLTFQTVGQASTKILNLQEVLYPLHVCKQIRDEAMGLQFGPEPITIGPCRARAFLIVHRPSSDASSGCCRCISQVPIHLRSPNLCFEYQYDTSVHHSSSHSGRFAITFNQSLEEDVVKLATAAYPTPLNMSVSCFLPEKAYKSVHPDHCPSISEKPIFVCTKDVAFTHDLREYIIFKLPTNNPVEARRLVESAFEERVRSFEAHRHHRVCFIRLGLGTSLQDLATAKSMMHKLINRIPTEQIAALSDRQG